MPAGAAVGLQGSEAVRGAVPVPLVCGDSSLYWSRLETGELACAEVKPAPSFSSFLPSVQLGLLGTPEQNVTTCFQQNSAREASFRADMRGVGRGELTPHGKFLKRPQT